MDISKSFEPKCAKNTCNGSEGYILQRLNETQHVCSKIDVFYEKYNQSLSLLTDEEAEDFEADFKDMKTYFEKLRNEEPDSITGFNTITVCNHRSHATGKCLGNTLEPQPNNVDLILDIRKAFNIPPQENVETLVFVEIEDYNNGTLVEE